MSKVRELAVAARQASRRLATLDRAAKDTALLAAAAALRAHKERVFIANRSDIEAARSSGLPEPMLDRLRMDDKVLEATARGVEFIVSLPDPVGSRSDMHRLASGVLAGRERIPLGVIAMVYESRPNVTVDAAALCLKAGNAVLLRGGKEALHTNRVLGEILQEALAGTRVPSQAVQIVPASDREGIRELLSLDDLIDLAIPRGGEGLIRFVAENARVPVIKHYKGVCHLFLDVGSDPAMAARLAVNGKVQRPSACNALECLLVHAADAERLLPPVTTALLAQGTELRGCARTREIVPAAKPATDDDWGREYLANILALRVVDDFEAALEHIARYGSNHTESICTDSHHNAQRFLREVDACCVLVNASTRFNDGAELGLGAEIGISTSKLHAYGPMGLESLTTQKWVVIGDGQIRG